MEKTARLFRPRLIIAGTSAYARLIDYSRMKKVLLKSSLFYSKAAVVKNTSPKPKQLNIKTTNKGNTKTDVFLPYENFKRLKIRVSIITHFDFVYFSCV